MTIHADAAQAEHVIDAPREVELPACENGTAETYVSPKSSERSIDNADLLALMGLDPDFGPLSIFLSKTYGAPLPILEDGHRLGPVERAESAASALYLYEKRVARPVVGVYPYRREWRIAMVDGVLVKSGHRRPPIITASGEVVEELGEPEDRRFLTHLTPASRETWADVAVVVAIVEDRDRDRWGPETGTLVDPRSPVGVPIRNVVECTWVSLVTGLPCDLVALFDDQIRVYPIGYDPFFVNAVEEAGRSFLQSFVEKGVRPPADDKPGTRFMLSRAFKEYEGKMLPPDERSVSLAQQLAAVRAVLRSQRSREREIVNELCAIVGSAGVAGIQDVCTWCVEEQSQILWREVLERLCARGVLVDDVRDDVVDKVEELIKEKRFWSVVSREFRTVGDPDER